MAQFVKAYHEILRDKNLKPTQKAVYLDLLSYRNSKTKLCCPSQKTIAEDLNVEIKTVSNAINVLIEKGYIEVKSSKKRGFIKNNSYTSFPKYEEVENNVVKEDSNKDNDVIDKITKSKIALSINPERCLHKFKKTNKKLIDSYHRFETSYIKKRRKRDIILESEGELQIDAFEEFKTTLSDNEKSIMDEYYEILVACDSKMKLRDTISSVLGFGITNKQTEEILLLRKYDEKGKPSGRELWDGIRDYEEAEIQNKEIIRNKLAYLKKCIENRRSY